MLIKSTKLKSEQIIKRLVVVAPTWMHVLCIFVELWEIFTKLGSFSEQYELHLPLELGSICVHCRKMDHRPLLGQSDRPLYLILMLHAPFCLLPQSWRLKKKKLKELWQDRRFCKEETKLQGRSLYSLNKKKKKENDQVIVIFFELFFLNLHFHY